MEEISDIVESGATFYTDISTFVDRLRLQPYDRWLKFSSGDGLNCVYETDLSGVRVELIRTQFPNRRKTDRVRSIDEEITMSLFFEDGNYVYVDGVNALEFVKHLYDALEMNVKPSEHKVSVYPQREDASVSA